MLSLGLSLMVDSFPFDTIVTVEGVAEPCPFDPQESAGGVSLTAESFRFVLIELAYVMELRQGMVILRFLAFKRWEIIMYIVNTALFK
jgi:hypothetical protein